MQGTNLKLCLFTEELQPPYDEGYKNFTFHLFREAAAAAHVLRLGRGDTELLDCQVKTNKLLTGKPIRVAIRRFSPDAVIYVPVSSATPASFLRARMLRGHARAPVIMIALQPREYTRPAAALLRLIAPDRVYVQSRECQDYLDSVGIKAGMVGAGVDAERFRPVSDIEKRRLRSKYGLSQDRRIVLHVGHIKESRNIRFLAQLTEQASVQVVVVGSSSTAQDRGLAKFLLNKGVVVIDRYVGEIEEVYQLSDVYVFPVREKTAAVEMPLSVLEAMACNLPVVTTPFGGLRDSFSEGEGFHFAEDDFPNKVMRALADKSSTRDMITDLTWPVVVRRLLTEIEELC